MPIDQEKLAKLQKAGPRKVGGVRVKAKKVKSEVDDIKLMETLGKLKATKIEHVEEAYFFKEDSTVLHFPRVGVQAASDSNSFAFIGYPQEKEIAKLIPGILPHLGSENLEALRKLAEQIQAGKAPTELDADAGEEDIPDLVAGEKFDEVE